MNLQQRNLFEKIIFGVLTLVISINICLGQTQSEQISTLLNQYLEYGKFNGSVLVADKGEVVIKDGFGLANMEWNIPNKPNTKHSLGSITRQFT